MLNWHEDRWQGGCDAISLREGCAVILRGRGRCGRTPGSLLSTRTSPRCYFSGEKLQKLTEALSSPGLGHAIEDDLRGATAHRGAAACGCAARIRIRGVRQFMLLAGFVPLRSHRRARAFPRAHRWRHATRANRAACPRARRERKKAKFEDSGGRDIFLMLCLPWGLLHNTKVEEASWRGIEECQGPAL